MAWITAEAAAYMALQQLYQRTQGGRLAPPDGRIEQIAKLRKEAEACFQNLWGTADAPPQRASVVPAPAKAWTKFRNPLAADRGALRDPQWLGVTLPYTTTPGSRAAP